MNREGVATVPKGGLGGAVRAQFERWGWAKLYDEAFGKDGI